MHCASYTPCAAVLQAAEIIIRDLAETTDSGVCQIQGVVDDLSEWHTHMHMHMHPHRAGTQSCNQKQQQQQEWQLGMQQLSSNDCTCAFQTVLCRTVVCAVIGT